MRVGRYALHLPAMGHRAAMAIGRHFSDDELHLVELVVGGFQLDLEIVFIERKLVHVEAGRNAPLGSSD